MKRKALLFILPLFFTGVWAQPGAEGGSRPGEGRPAGAGISVPQSMNGLPLRDEFVVDVNPMTNERRNMLNAVASKYRSKNRGVLLDLGQAMLYGGVTSVVNVISTEIINLTKIRKNQRAKWEAMRNRECMFIDSLQSVKGQRDFYRMPSNYGPLDPTDMNFDGITFRARRGGKDVLRMVCHLDTTRFTHLFMHSKFYLVLDTLEFHPYESYLPNLSANRIMGPGEDASEDEKEYWNTISRFDFNEQQEPSVNIRMDITSSWINEAVQVYQDVHLGSFSVDIPIKESMLRDSVYFYSREEALARGQETIDISGDCFVVPRSYMPVSATSPSWGTGEYKMKVVMSQKCRYNPKDGRARDWHKDYKQLVRMQNNGKNGNDYISDIVTTFRDNSSTILKATYTPLLNYGVQALGLSGSAGASKAQMTGGAPAASGKPAGGSPQKGQKP